MSAIDDLRNLPLSSLFSGPLVAAIDASLQAQSEQIDLLLEAGYDDGELVTVSFSYTTTELDPDTGRSGRVAKELEVPLLLFLTLPNLVITEIEEEFSAKLTEVEETSRENDGSQRLRPLRLKVAPAGQSTTLDRTTRSQFDLDVRMVAELDQQSIGMEMLERAANNAITERVDDAATKRLRANPNPRRSEALDITENRPSEPTEE